MSRTKFDLALWRNSAGQVYGFPLGAKDPWLEPMGIEVDFSSWEPRGLLPKSMPVTQRSPSTDGHCVSCVAAGLRIFTATWAIDDDTRPVPTRMFRDES